MRRVLVPLLVPFDDVVVSRRNVAVAIRVNVGDVGRPLVEVHPGPLRRRLASSQSKRFTRGRITAISLR